MASATVARSALLSFSDNVPATQQVNVRNTVMRAIADANDKYNRNRNATNAANWFVAYWTSLKANCWSGPDPGVQSSVSNADYNVPIGSTVQQQLLPYLDAAQNALLDQVLKALQLPGGAAAQRILGQTATETTSSKAANSSDPIRAVNFMVGACRATPSGNIILESLHISYRYTPPDVIFGFDGRITDVSALSHTIEFNITAYANKDDGTTISDSDNTYISSIDLGPNATSSSSISGKTVISSSQDQALKLWANSNIKIYEVKDTSGNVIGHQQAVIVKGPSAVASGYPFNIVLFSIVEINGSIDLSSFACNFTAYLIVPVPFIPKLNIGGISGNLKDGITLNVDLTVAKGAVTLHIERTNELYCNINLDTIFGKWNTDLDLFTIPLLG